MTGQVKEEILTRLGEMGVEIEAGVISFNPRLLRREEFLAAPAEWSCIDTAGKMRTLSLPAGALAFTLCQTPIIHRLAAGDCTTIAVRYRDGCRTDISSAELDHSASQAVLGRTGEIAEIEVALNEASLR